MKRIWSRTPAAAAAAIVLCSILWIAGCPQEVGSRADVVFFNGKVYTVDEQFSVAQAVAIRGKEIIAVGSDDEILALAGSETRRIDLEGKTVVPGLVDAHAHLLGYAGSLDRLDLVGTTSAEEIAQMVAAKAAEVGPDVWISGRGWDQNDWEVKRFPTHEVLDQAAPDNPVVLTRIDGHAIWVNSRALEIAGITGETADPSGGEIIRDEHGDPTGILVDNAEGLIFLHVPQSTTPERREELLVEAIENCLAAGLVGIHDMGGGPQAIELFKKLIDEGRFDFKVYFNLSAGLENLDELLAAGHINYGDGKLVVRSVKCFSDGALGSRGAAMIEPYSDRPESTGLIVQGEAELTDVAIRALRAGFQVSTHAIGDMGNRITLNAYEAALGEVPTEDARLRVEHAQILAPEDIGRFAELGVLPSMQPTHCTSDLPWAIDRVGNERILGAYAWRTLIDSGAYIPCGSDFPVEQIDPMLGFYAAITRQHTDGTPDGGYFPEQRMTREEALRGFTIWAARAAFAEDVMGSLEAGKRADLVVLDRDIMTVEPQEVLRTQVLLTMVDGMIAFER